MLDAPDAAWGNSGMNFAENLKRLRKRAKLSQEQLALACGFNGQSRISNYEASPDKEYAREPKLEEIPIIAKALGAEIGELFGVDPGTPKESSAPLDPALVFMTYDTLQKMTRDTYQILRDPARFVHMYALCSTLPPRSSMQEREAFSTRMAAVHGDERTDGLPADAVPADGTRKEKVARRVRDKT